jgi:hypothetical protein
VSVTTAPQRNDVADAILVLLNARLSMLAPGTYNRPFAASEIDDAPTSGGDYVVVFVGREQGGQYRLGGVGSTMWRLTVRAVGSVTNVGRLLDICGDVLEDHSVTAGGIESGCFRFVSADDIRQDEDEQALYYGDADWSFAF